MADALMEFGKPLLQDCRSPQQTQFALLVIQICWNVALEPPGQRESFLAAILEGDHLSATQRQEIQRVAGFMVERHQQMFPGMHAGKRVALQGAAADARPGRQPQLLTPHAEKYPGTGRNVSCPCGSGKKYKRCCAAA